MGSRTRSFTKVVGVTLWLLLVFSLFVFENIRALSTDLSIKGGFDPPLYGPSSGSMKHKEDDYIEVHAAQVSVGHFVAEATFYNPYSTAKGSWDYGFLFRYVEVGTFHAIRVMSDGRWIHSLVTSGKWSTIGEGKISTLKTGAAQYNHLCIIILGDSGTFCVNGQFIASLDISGLTQKGDIKAATGMVTGDEIEGEVTRFERFTIWSLDTPMFGPSNWNLQHDEDGYIETYRAGVTVEDFITEATFYNPYSTTKGSWDYGFLCRLSESNTYNAIRVDSDGSWKHDVVIDGDWSTVKEGQVKNLQTNAAQYNHLRIIVLGDRGEFYVNGKFIASLDMSGLAGAGDVRAATGIVAGNEITGEITRFKNFCVWSLHIQSKLQKTGSIHVTSAPSGARCYLDESYKGITPLTIADVSPGSHKITLEKDNYYKQENSVFVSAAEVLKVHFTLRIQMGSLSVDSTVGGAYVYLDGGYRGSTPLKIDKIPVGKHVLRISADKYYDYTETIIIEADKTTYVDAALEEKPGSIHVESDPAGAEVYVNGSYKGKTPYTISARPGTYTVTLRYDGYYEEIVYVDVYPDEKTTEYVRLQKEFWRTGSFIVGVPLAIIALLAVIFWYRRKQPAPPSESSIAKIAKGTIEASMRIIKKARFFSQDNLPFITMPDEKNVCPILNDSLEEGELVKCTHCEKEEIECKMHKNCWEEYKLQAKKNEIGEIRCPKHMYLYISKKDIKELPKVNS